MQQVLFRIPIQWNWFPEGIPIFGFGAMLFIAFILCTWIAGRRAEREGISKDVVQDLAIWLFIGGLLGARVVSILNQKNPPQDILAFLAQLPRIWDGGIVLYGSVLGGLGAYLLAYWFVFRKQGINTFKLADIIAPSIAVGLCLGRIGCFLNGCCYGQVACTDCAVYPVHFPLSAPARYALVDAGYQTTAGFTLADPSEQALTIGGVKIGQVEPGSAAALAGIRPGDIIEKINGEAVATVDALADHFLAWPHGKTEVTLEIRGKKSPIIYSPRTLGLHPTQLYETVSMLLLFLFLTAVYPFRTRNGQIVSLLMIGYGMHRYLNELLRIDPRPEGLESYGSLFLILSGIAMLLWVSRMPAQYRIEWPSAT